MVIVETQQNRTVLTGDEQDLEQFRHIVAEARRLPAYGGGPPDAQQIRKGGLDFADGPLAYPVPQGLTREWVDAGGVRACWFIRDDHQQAAPVLYLHGGGYVGGSVEASRGIAACLAETLQAPVLAVEYRQGPEHPFPAAVEDACAAYRWLLGRTDQAITVTGDSAGGALAFGAALDAARSDMRPARAAILMSAWIDFALTGYSWQANRDKDLASTELGRFFLDSYLAKTAPAEATPFFFDQISKAPPTLVLMGGVEGPLDSTVAFVERARAEGVHVDLEVYTDMPHNFMKFRSPICDQAYRRIGVWIRGL